MNQEGKWQNKKQKISYSWHGESILEEESSSRVCKNPVYIPAHGEKTTQPAELAQNQNLTISTYDARKGMRLENYIVLCCRIAKIVLFCTRAALRISRSSNLYTNMTFAPSGHNNRVPTSWTANKLLRLLRIYIDISANHLSPSRGNWVLTLHFNEKEKRKKTLHEKGLD